VLRRTPQFVSVGSLVFFKKRVTNGMTYSYKQMNGVGDLMAYAGFQSRCTSEKLLLRPNKSNSQDKSGLSYTRCVIEWVARVVCVRRGRQASR
jgi:hypothetical protein